jgi:hypothetical protein
MKHYLTSVNGTKVCIVSADNYSAALNKFETFVKGFTPREQKATFGANTDEEFNVDMEEDNSDIILLM